MLKFSVTKNYVELRATVSWNFVLYRIAPPARSCTIPVTERRCFVSPAKSESTIDVSVIPLVVCVSSDGVYDVVSVRCVGGGSAGRSVRGDLRQ